MSGAYLIYVGVSFVLFDKPERKVLFSSLARLNSSRSDPVKFVLPLRGTTTLSSVHFTSPQRTRPRCNAPSRPYSPSSAASLLIG